MVQVFVTIPTISNWPTADELAARNAVTVALSAAGIGSCTGAGGGRGEMDFSYRVADESAARAAIASAMEAHMPGVVYRVRVSDE
jgi:hypothetical protein